MSTKKYMISLSRLVTKLLRLRLDMRSTTKNSVKLSDEQQAIYEILEHSHEHAFVTGKAGTGKSVLLKQFAASTNKTVFKLAPTGISALNIKGQTIHSFFELKPGLIDNSTIVINKQAAQLLRSADAIIIDEISMVRADTIDAINHILREARNNSEPFGGTQLIMFGDVYQLPPVVESADLRAYFTNNLGGPYFFNARVWAETRLSVHELQHVYRQKDNDFRSILNAIRNGSREPWVLDALKDRVLERDKALPKDIVALTSTNAAARAINNSQISNLRGKQRTYHAIITGNIPESSFPTESKLTLVVGAQVVFLKNDSSRRWVNGTVGTVISLSKHHVRVKCGKKIHKVAPAEWEKYTYSYNQGTNSIDQEPAGSFAQIPLKLAWAITIHKSQGQTYSKVVVDLSGGAFAHGQTYVALSRCRTLAGLHLLGEIRPSDIIVEPAIIKFMESKLD